MVTLTAFGEIKNYPLYKDCTVVLKATSYSPQEKCRMLFINCRTQDDRIIVCCGPISLHKDGNEVKAGDILEFQNVQPHEDKKSGITRLCLKIRGESTVYIIDPESNSKKKIISPNVPVVSDYPETLYSLGFEDRSTNFIPKSYNFETGSMTSSFTLKPKDNKIVGIIKNNFILEKPMEDDPDYEEGVYVTTLLLFNGEEKELVISKKLGTWPVDFLHPMQVVSVDGELAKRDNKDAIFVGLGNHLGSPSIEDVNAALQYAKIPSRRKSVSWERKYNN
ncbi:hypothetical protein FO519_009705 [Halicephalobus sp. NKZ332]|nr:hypothetical protein FO519_009705 [Halicephalobus sp. NKZ332]